MSLVYNSNKFQYAVSQSLPFEELRRGFSFNAFNCMKAYSYNGEHYGYYGYDASGERTYKIGLDKVEITTNQGEVFVTGSYWEANEMMFYPNGYMNMNQDGQYTKHYYAGALRIASKIGRGTSGLDLCNDAAIIDNTYPDYLEDRKNIQYEEMKEELTELVPGSQDILDITPIPYPNFCDIGGGGQENDLFFYHPDHLGSTGVITDNNASITQGFLYAPFGELIYEHDLLWQYDRIPKYAFNAKELDEENGMYYYSARYYAPPTFISRDPMMEVKPWLSPYHYCSNSPLNRVDPTGMLDEDPSVHIDKYGNVIAQYDDNDNGVYVHADGTTKEQIDQQRAANHNTGGTGTKIGELGKEIYSSYIMINKLRKSAEIAKAQGIVQYFFLVKPNGFWDLKNNTSTIWGIAWRFDATNSRKTQFIYGNYSMNAADVGNYHAGYVGRYTYFGFGMPYNLLFEGAGLAEMAKSISKGWFAKLLIQYPSYYYSFSPFGDNIIDYEWNKKGMEDADKSKR